MRSREVDLISGRREMNLREIIAAEEEERATWGFWKRYISAFVDMTNFQDLLLALLDWYVC